MPATLIHINHSYPAHVPVLIGAPEELVTHRELRNKYQTNRHIKTWACWFQLKALTTSNKIQNWYKQLDHLLPFLQMNENTLRRRLCEMIELQLITVVDGDIYLISYEKAAALLNIPYAGTIKVEYNPTKHEGKQIFQYLLRSEEMRSAQLRQLDALLYHLDQNPLLKKTLHILLVKAGADDQRLYKEPRYYQERLLQLQMQYFKEGSELLDNIMLHRADINRGVKKIQENHAYKATQSASYLKKRLYKLRLIQVEKVCVESKQRSRLYIPDGDTRRDGYKYVAATKRTAWFLTDQINFTYEIQSGKTAEKKGQKVA